MAKYTVDYSDSVEVEADSEDEAEEIARDNWESADWLDGDIDVVDVEELKE